MPFVTEEIYANIKERDAPLCVQAWPEAEKKLIDKDALKSMETIIGLVTAIRNIRATWNISPKEQVQCMFEAKSEAKLLQDNEAIIKRLGRISEFSVLNFSSSSSNRFWSELTIGFSDSTCRDSFAMML